MKFFIRFSFWIHIHIDQEHEEDLFSTEKERQATVERDRSEHTQSQLLEELQEH